MVRKLALALGLALMAAAVAARINNGWVFPVLGSYDAFSHFTYIWHLAEGGRVPVASQGWSYFHPPLYYAFMAAFWQLLDGSDPLLRLRVGKTVVAALGCVHPVIAWWIVRRRFPHDPRPAWAAATLLLFVPVLLYSAGFLGNEGLGAALCSLSLLALVRVLENPSPLRAVLLGLALGLAMLTKFTAVVVVAASLATLALKGALALRSTLARENSLAPNGAAPRGGAGVWQALAISSVVMLALCGPYYARNVELFGNPFQFARDITFMTAYVERNQPQAARGWADYLTFDPVIFRRPVWPRGATASEDPTPHGFERSVRESVWTGLYANTWFDGFGGWVLPPVTDSEGARRAGQILLCLGLLPTALMLLGAWSALGRVRRDGWDDQVAVFALTTGAMLALFVYGTHQVPIAAAVKATYLTPACVAFAFWFALGVQELGRRSANALRTVLDGCGALALVSLAVFWQGLLFDPASQRSSIPRYDESKQNQYGIVYYAAGRSEQAREIFEGVAATNYHLAVENLGFLAIDAGRPRQGLGLLRRAWRLQLEQVDGGPIGRDEFLTLTEAEHNHSMAVVLHGLGRTERAVVRWHKALRLDPLHAEALWCLALTQLEDGIATARNEVERGFAYADAERALTNVRVLDPGLEQGWQLAVAVHAARGDCDGARRMVDQWKALPWWTDRRYPAVAGNGAGLSASIGRRRLISPRRPELDTHDALAACHVVFP